MASHKYSITLDIIDCERFFRFSPGMIRKGAEWFVDALPPYIEAATYFTGV